MNRKHNHDSGREERAFELARPRSPIYVYLLWAGILLSLYLTSFHHYLLFHGLAEIFSVVIACGIFMFVWNSRRFIDNNYFVVLGVAYLFIALVDTLHALAYRGMDVFHGYDSDLATKLWVQARFIQAMSFLVAPFFLRRKVRISYLLAAYLSVTGLLLASIFYWKIFPTCFIDGQGLTLFKKVSEYWISGIFIASILLLSRERKHFDPEVFKLLVASISVTILSEICFTEYVSVYGAFNLAGHLFKIIAFYLIYKATIEIGLSKPYGLLFRTLKQSEQQLLAERNRAQTYLDIAGVIIVVVDAEQTVTLINKKGCEILGYPASEIIGKNWVDAFIPERMREGVRDIFLGLLSGARKPVEYFENPVISKDGDERLIAWRNKILRDETGRGIAVLSSGEDVTDRRLFERILKESEERFRMAVDNYPAIFVIYDSQRRIKFINNYGARIYGIPKEKLLGRLCEEIRPPEYTQSFLPVLKRAFETKTTHTLECPLRSPLGMFIFVMTYVPMLDENGEIKQMLGISYDVTERKLAEDALKQVRDNLEVTVARRTAELRETNQLLQKILSSTHFCIVYLDPQFNFIRVNKAYADSCGHPPEYFIGRNHFDLYPDKENEDIFKKVVQTGSPFSTYAKAFKFKDHPEWGITYWDWSLLPVNNSAGKVEGLVFCLVDVTKRKLAEDELSQTQRKLVEAKRLSDIGTLAATVAHELRNPLAAIHMTAFNMFRKAKNPELTKYFNLIEKKIEESDEIINNLLFYSRIKPPRYTAVRIGDIIRECMSVARTRYKETKTGAEIKIAPVNEISIDGDAVQLKEVFSNIINNAYDALWNRAGKVTVTGGIEGGRVSIQIKDTGPGIDQEVLQNVFDPFFTTKAKGTGLGLTVCKQIVDLHNGDINIITGKEQGTTVIVRLPVSKGYRE